ncbi:hypothetical protein BU26DRAFT_520649 [Trematosphaeria pertusa]|uniref:Uncharacterized protein n=1 Tax=Trematosphaeria pertusa TaxID=390896 RepID=A0A6A6IBD3_9PLEO|nr:uncharacterized protein BU26DRAFT_520649 [Trematosphaeria pertusa]KAF2247517.1 hypothetical protein BU26DRAFT_520649 [Trematosphaeria pertusa]
MASKPRHTPPSSFPHRHRHSITLSPNPSALPGRSISIRLSTPLRRPCMDVWLFLVLFVSALPLPSQPQNPIGNWFFDF